MTRPRIGGTLDLDALVRLATLHRPSDPDTLAREARALIAMGLSIPDAAQAIGMTPRAVADLLVDGWEPTAAGRADPIVGADPKAGVDIVPRTGMNSSALPINDHAILNPED